MHILLTNDDGIHAVGLQTLHKALVQAGHTVFTAAPAAEQSGVSSSVTLHSPLRVGNVTTEHFSGTAVHGTPADCVKMALLAFNIKPDLVLAGINAGPNIGVDVLYSGTVGAAMEGAMAGLPAMAISRQFPWINTNDDQLCAAIAEHALELIARMDWPALAGRVLNVNYPCDPNKANGLRVCDTSTAPWNVTYERRNDPRERPYWWLSFAESRTQRYAEPEQNTDCAFFMQDYVTLSPLQPDMIDRSAKQLVQASINNT